MNKPLIAISGIKFSGKTTLANALAKHYDIPATGFAAPLKMGLRWMGCEVEGPDKDVEALQAVGTDFFRNRDPDWWVKLLQDLRNLSAGLIIDDMRFQNEFRWARDHGFLTVHLELSPVEQLRRAVKMGVKLTNDIRTHASEHALCPVGAYQHDLTFSQNTTLDERLSAVIAALQERGFEGADHAGGGVPDMVLGQTETECETSPSTLAQV